MGWGGVGLDAVHVRSPPPLPRRYSGSKKESGAGENSRNFDTHISEISRP